MKGIIITPVYNGADVLPRFLYYCTLLSPYYHIFVTNNCTDGSNEMIDKYLSPGLEGKRGNKVDIFTSPRGCRISWDYPSDFTEKMNDPYTGLAVARQRAINEAKKYNPDYILLTDDDTIILDNDALDKVENLLFRYLQTEKDEFKQCHILGGSYLRDFPHGRTLASKWIDREQEQVISYREIFKDVMTPYVTSGGFLALSSEIIYSPWFTWFPIYNEKRDTPSADDFGFCILARRAGYEIFLDGTIKLEHLIRVKERGWTVDDEGVYLPFEYKKDEKN